MPVKPLTDATFDDALHADDRLLLVDFWADWCGPCKAVAPALEDLSERYAERIRFAKVDADRNRRLMQAFGVKSLPTLILLNPHDGGADVVAHMVGAKPAHEIEALLERVLNPPPSLGQRLARLFGRG